MPLLEVRGISKTFGRGAGALKAIDDVSLSVEEGECVALVGESGSGKSTLARLALRLLEPDSGDVLLQGRSLMAQSRSKLRSRRLPMQPIFQDPAASFNPRRRVRSILQQAATQARPSQTESLSRLCELLDQVELRPAVDYLDRYPHELSGGQRQRLAIARALAVEPAIIIADEPLSGADVSIRAQILNLLMDLQASKGLAYLLITHDMLVAEAFSHRIAVMYRGRIVEEGLTREVLQSPYHPYTKQLLAAVHSVDAAPTGTEVFQRAEPAFPTAGCAFYGRCPVAIDPCVEQRPEPSVLKDQHRVSCLHVEWAKF